MKACNNFWKPSNFETINLLIFFFLSITCNYGSTEANSHSNSTVVVCSTKKLTNGCVFDFASALMLIGDNRVQTILLDAGEHVLSYDSANPICISNILSGISIIGQSEDRSKVVVKCKNGLGLAFFNVTNLTISNVTILGCGVPIYRIKDALQIYDSSLFSEMFGGTNLITALFIGRSVNVTILNMVIRDTNGVGMYGINLGGHSVLQQTVFKNNTYSGDLNTGSGGGAHLIFQEYHNTSESIGDRIITVTDCVFTDNKQQWEGGQSSKPHSYQTLEFQSGGRGTGLNVVMSQAKYTVELQLCNCVFQNNAADVGAGVLISVLKESGPLLLSEITPSVVHISIQDCDFIDNSAQIGASALLVHKTDSCLSPNDTLHVENCTFINNSVLFMESNTSVHQFSPIIGTTVSVHYLNTSFTGKNMFSLNVGTAFEAVSCSVYLKGYTEFNRNQGVFGGGLRILGSGYIFMYSSAILNFTENKVILSGGAIYAGLGILSKDPLKTSTDQCFLYFETLNTKDTGACPNFQTPKLHFNGNQADTGYAVYGSTLTSCDWATRFHDQTSLKEHMIYDILVKLCVMVFNGLSQASLLGTGFISTPIYSITVTGGPDKATVMPGQVVDLQVTAVDKFDQPVSSYLIAIGSEFEIQPIRSENGKFVVNGSDTLSLVVMGKPNQTLTITLLSSDVHSSGFIIYTHVIVSLVPCMPGSEFNTSINQCKCIRKLISERIQCDVESGTLKIPDGKWFGRVPSGDDHAENLSLGFSQCLENYCKPGNVNISGADFDSQCFQSLHRTGVACGSCKPGYSASLGSYQCQKCSNLSLFLIIVFAVVGIVTVLALAFLRITIAEGYLNSVLFYSNIVNIFAFHFTSQTLGKGAFVLASWVSQNVGVPICFYDGMSTLSVFGLHYVYISYLFALIVLSTLIAKYVQLPLMQEYAPSKVIATLLVICYSCLVETSIEILAFSRVTTLDGGSLIRWYYDSNVAYFEGIHALLCVVSLGVLLIVIIPFPFFVMSPRLTYKIKYMSKLQPMFDAFWAPFKPKMRWWLSFRLLFRWVSVIISSFVESSYGVLIMQILLVVLLFVQSHLLPFRNFWPNIIDNTLVLILTLLFSGYTLFNINHNEQILTYFNVVLAIISYLLFILVLIIHIYIRFPNCKGFLKNLPSYLKLKFASRRYVHHRLNIEEDDESDTPVVTYSVINITREEREDNSTTLTEELSESQFQDSSTATSMQAHENPNVALLNTNALDVTTSNVSTFPLNAMNRVKFDEDREPLLTEGNDNL